MRVLLDRILGLVGAKQNGQQIQALLQQLTYVESQTQVIDASFQQAALADMAERPIVEESIGIIHQQVLTDWPQ
jgi:hypothetical protein